MIQSEPTEAQIEAGRIAYYTNEFSGHAHAKGLAQAYLAMKALDPDFATRTDSQSTDAVERVARAIDHAETDFVEDHLGVEKTQELHRQKYRAMARAALAALSPSQSDNGEA